MLKIYKCLSQLHFAKLMAVYSEGNAKNAVECYPMEERTVALEKAEQDFYQYLCEDFFGHRGACYCVWQLDESYASALRLEPYRDGLLLEALETKPELRGKGYASALIRAVQNFMEGSTIYSHVHKRNTASLKTHLSCGFQITQEYAVYIDGSVSQYAYTLCWRQEKEG